MDSLDNNFQVWEHQISTDENNWHTDSFTKDNLSIRFDIIPLPIWIIVNLLTVGVVGYIDPGVYVPFQGRDIKLKGYERWSLRFWYRKWRRGADNHTVKQAQLILKE